MGKQRVGWTVKHAGNCGNGNNAAISNDSYMMAGARTTSGPGFPRVFVSQAELHVANPLTLQSHLKRQLRGRD